MTDSRETGLTLDPKWDADGLITAVVTDGDLGDGADGRAYECRGVGATVDSGEAVFWSRSRGELWRKGATSGNVMRCATCGSIAIRMRCG